MRCAVTLNSFEIEGGGGIYPKSAVSRIAISVCKVIVPTESFSVAIRMLPLVYA